MAVAKPGDYIRWGVNEGYVCDAFAGNHHPTNYLIHLEEYKPREIRATDMVMPLAELGHYLQVTVPCPVVPKCKEARRR